ncbi:MAG: hypothetical protein F4W93_11675 [Dehalococcoidia bacterium]|nr:hypothetical protein [Dehalococcoidia bacterium]
MTDELAAHPKRTVTNSGGSTEQELRKLSKCRYPSKETAIASMRDRWKTMPLTPKEQADWWLEETRSRPI